DVVVAGRGLVAPDPGEGVRLGDRPGLVVEAASHAGAGDAIGAGRAADGPVGGDVGAVEVQDRVGIGGDQPPGGVGVAVEDAAAQGVAAVAARAAGPARGQVGADGAVAELEGRDGRADPAVVDAAAQ